jgi:hypothetical protein
MHGIRRGSSLVGDAVVLGWAQGRFPRANAVHFRYAAHSGHSGRSREKHSIYVPGAANMFEAIQFWLPLLRPSDVGLLTDLVRKTSALQR